MLDLAAEHGSFAGSIGTLDDDGPGDGVDPKRPDDVAAWREKYPNVPVKIVVVRGTAADVLIGVSKSAQLVVVGTRGHGGFAGLLLGSVGQQLMHHSESPVLIVRQ